jgi:hypothetical protein
MRFAARGWERTLRNGAGLWYNPTQEIKVAADVTVHLPLVDYLDHQTLGYDTSGKLRLAFSTEGFT